MSKEAENSLQVSNRKEQTGVDAPEFDWGEIELTFSDWVTIQPAPDGMAILSFFQGGYPFNTEKYNEMPLHCLARFIVSSEQFERILSLYTEFQESRKSFLKTQSSDKASTGDSK